MVDGHAQLADTCHRCGYALAGLEAAVCPECGATDITLAHEHARAVSMRAVKNRAPGALVFSAVLGVMLLTIRSVFLIAKSPTPSAVAVGMFACLCLAPAAMLAWFSSRHGLARTMTPRNFTERSVAFSFTGTGAIVGAAITWALAP